MQLNHPRTTPYPQSMEELSWTKPVPGAEKVGDCCFTVLSDDNTQSKTATVTTINTILIYIKNSLAKEVSI